MSYFAELVSSCKVLDTLAQGYLDQFEFMSTDDMCRQICSKCYEIFYAHNEEFGVVPELYRDELEMIVDGCMPYLAYALKPGSLKKSLGLSIVSVDAHLRNLLERLEGRTDCKLAFGIEVE